MSKENTEKNGQETGNGYLEISEKGFGFLRTPQNHFHPKPTHRGTSPQLKSVDEVNGMRFEDYTKAVRFENLTSIDPIEKFRLETSPDLIETRVIDMVTPLGKGTRGLIVAPPRTGKTTILKQIANSI